MVYYNADSIGEYTNNEKLAQLFVTQGKWKSYGKSEEPYVMQSDNSGYVLKSEYVEPAIVEQPNVTDVNDTILTIMFGDSEKKNGTNPVVSFLAKNINAGKITLKQIEDSKEYSVYLDAVKDIVNNDNKK